jgi:hypothetical protein
LNFVLLLIFLCPSCLENKALLLIDRHPVLSNKLKTYKR